MRTILLQSNPIQNRSQETSGRRGNRDVFFNGLPARLQAGTLHAMHIMFVDESGDPGFPRDGNWAKFGGSKFYVRVGLIIHGWKWNAWNKRLVAFKRNRGLLWNDEIKASNIFYNKVSQGVDAPEWISIARRLWKGNGKKGMGGITRLP